jgi:hypothetical protein
MHQRKVLRCDTQKGVTLKKYRRIEVNAYHRRVTVVSGEWRTVDVSEESPPEADNGVSLDDSNSCEPVEPDSPEGQLILVEAVRSLEQRLLPETRALISAAQDAPAPTWQNQSRVFRRLQSIYQSVCPKALRFARKEE